VQRGQRTSAHTLCVRVFSQTHNPTQASNTHSAHTSTHIQVLRYCERYRMRQRVHTQSFRYYTQRFRHNTHNTSQREGGLDTEEVACALCPNARERPVRPSSPAHPLCDALCGVVAFLRPKFAVPSSGVFSTKCSFAVVGSALFLGTRTLRGAALSCRWQWFSDATWRV